MAIWILLLTVFSGIALAAGLCAAVCIGALIRDRLRARGLWGRRGQVIVDGSNVMYWKTGQPGIAAIRDVLERLDQAGLKAGVMFDANAGYLLTGQYEHNDAMARHLGLPEERVMVVPKGTSADGFILEAARDLNARIVTNDRFRDWFDDFPEIRDRSRLIPGEYRSGELTLRLS